MQKLNADYLASIWKGVFLSLHEQIQRTDLDRKDFCFASHVTLLLDLSMVFPQEHLVIVNFSSWNGRVGSL